MAALGGLEAGLTIIFLWWVYWHVPEVRAFIQVLPTLVRDLVHYIERSH